MLKATTFFDWAYSNLIFLILSKQSPYNLISGVKNFILSDLFLNLKTKVDLFSDSSLVFFDFSRILFTMLFFPFWS